MSHLRNVAFAVLAVVFVASAAQAGETVVESGDLTAVLIAPNQSIADGGVAFCQSIVMCEFRRSPPLDKGENANAVVLTVPDDGVTVHVKIDVYAAARCTPREAPDATIEGDVPLPSAGTWIVFGRLMIPTGTPYSQIAQVQNVTTGTDCGPSYCVNSQSGSAPGDCDAM